jgi:hypothetical protein
LFHHHHQSTKLSHSINAISLAPHRGGRNDCLSALGKPGVFYQDFDDDGEAAAGGQLLHLLQVNERDERPSLVLMVFVAQMHALLWFYLVTAGTCHASRLL